MMLNENKPPGLLEAVASFETVGLFVDPQLFDPNSFRISFVSPNRKEGRLHKIPVCYELGEDLIRVSNFLNLEAAELIELHSGGIYTCFAVGFCPGFAYLGPVPAEINSTVRLDSPRVLVPPGSVALAANQTGVYPLARPGGWNLIGRTPLEMVSVEENYFPICAGDQVQFYPVSPGEFDLMAGGRL